MINPEKVLKKISLKLISPLIKKKSALLDPQNWKQFKKVLVFRLDNKLGNAILLLPLIQSIKRSAPEIEVDILYSANYAQVFENHPDIHERIIYDQEKLLKRPWRYLGLIRQLRRKKYDVVISSTNSNSFSVSQAIFAGFLKAKHTIGFDWKESAQLYDHVVKGNTKVHYCEAQIDLWRYFDHNAKFENPKVYFTGAQKTDKSHFPLLFWIGATGNKILPRKLFEEITDILKKSKIPFQIAAGPHDVHLLKRYPSIDKNEVILQHGSLKDTAAFFRKYKLIVMPDTGPMHLAVALGIPTVQVFVKSNAVWYAYQGDHLFLIDKKINQQDFLHFIKKHLD